MMVDQDSQINLKNILDTAGLHLFNAPNYDISSDIFLHQTEINTEIKIQLHTADQKLGYY